jgi:hypothetical protein
MLETRVDERRGSKDLVDEQIAEVGHRWLAQLLEGMVGQWWCGACRELRTRSELEGFERAGQMVYACLACGELVEALPL